MERIAQIKRQAIINRMVNSLEEINQLFLDAEHWNSMHPEERIDPDPDGKLKQLKSGLEASLEREASLGNVPEVLPDECG